MNLITFVSCLYTVGSIVVSIRDFSEESAKPSDKERTLDSPHRGIMVISGVLTGIDTPEGSARKDRRGEGVYATSVQTKGEVVDIPIVHALEESV